MKKPGESVIPLGPGLFSVCSTSCEVKPLVAPHSGIRQNGTSLVRLPLAYTPDGLPMVVCILLIGDKDKYTMCYPISAMVIVPTIVPLSKVKFTQALDAPFEYRTHNAWNWLHRTEEALIEIEPIEMVVSGALYFLWLRIRNLPILHFEKWR